MLRIRGTMYLGRGITDTGSDEDEMMIDEDAPAAGHDSQLHPPHHHHQASPGNVVLLVPSHDREGRPQHQQHPQQHLEYPPSLLEKILSSPRASPIPQDQQQQQVMSKGLCSGGTVEVMEQIKQRMLLAEEQNHRAAVAVAAARSAAEALSLTPPPSISGESNARSTPPEAGYTDLSAATASASSAPLDLTVRQQQHSSSSARLLVAGPKASPVILEQVLPHHLAAGASPSSSELFYYKPELKTESEGSHYSASRAAPGGEQQPDLELDSAERIAVNALLALGRPK